MFPQYTQENFVNILKLADGLKEIGALGSLRRETISYLSRPIPGTEKVRMLPIDILHEDPHMVLYEGHLNEPEPKPSFIPGILTN